MITTVFLFHPHLEDSRINARLARTARAATTPDNPIHVRDMYALYPDFHINVPTEQTTLTTTDRIVLQFPVYWYSCPPLLKKWEDDVLTHGWAYLRLNRHRPTRQRTRPLRLHRLTRPQLHPRRHLPLHPHRTTTPLPSHQQPHRNPLHHTLHHHRHPHHHRRRPQPPNNHLHHLAHLHPPPTRHLRITPTPPATHAQPAVSWEEPAEDRPHRASRIWCHTAPP